MNRAFAYVWVFLLVACGESTGSPKDSIAEGGSAGAGGSGGSATAGSSMGGGAGSGSGGTASGGTASGGTASGGTASGGSSSGGSAGSGTQPECVSAGDCKLHSDCCDCSGVPKDEDVVDCPATCAVDQCNRAGISEPQCVAGRCVAGYECDASKVTCAQPTPQCPAGEVAAVQGGCWTGTCVPAVECRSVTQCNDCTGGNTACAAYETQLGPENHCVEIPAVCNGAATCECMGPSVCVQGFDLCEDFSGIRGVRCGCPTC